MQNGIILRRATAANCRCLLDVGSLRGLMILLLWGTSSLAQVPPHVSLLIPNETEPPSGMLEMKVVLTEPEPIITGGMALSFQALTFQSGPLGPVQGMALFSAAGDVSGAAVVDQSRIQAIFNSPQGSFGTGTDLTIAVIAIPVRDDANPGDRASLDLDLSASWMVDPLGQTYEQEVRPGVLTVGGRLSITDVIPGSAVVPADSPITVRGLGFQARARVQIEGATVTSTRFVSPNELEAIVAEETQMHGRRVRVRNADGSMATYYSFLRSTPLGESSRPLLAATLPVFAVGTFTEGYFNPSVDAGRFFALAFQTPGSQPADIAVEAYSAEGEPLGSTTLTLPPGLRISREASEFLPDVPFAPGTYLRSVSSVPVQMLGLIGDERGGTVVPVDPSPLPP